MTLSEETIPPAKNCDGYPPRVIFFRHGETEWSLSGQHTSITNLPLTANGEARVKASGLALVGPDRLVDLRHIARVICSPRRRARRTLQLIVEHCNDQPEPKPKLVTVADDSEEGKDAIIEKADGENELPVEFTERIREWDYGLYEGLTTRQINRWRIKKGISQRTDGKPNPFNKDRLATENGEPIEKKLKVEEKDVPRPDPEEDLDEQAYKAWSIWREGCEDGELPEEVCSRIDSLIDYIIGIQQQAIREGKSGDVVLVAHGHILRSFTMRWLKLDLDTDPQIRLILEAGGTGVLSYEHGKWDERAINLGGAFTVPGSKK